MSGIGKMSKYLAWLALLSGIAAVAFFGILPGIIADRMNVVTPVPDEASPRALALHETLSIADLHGDTLMWKRSLLEPHEGGHIDLPRLQAGNVAIQVFSSVSKTPKGQNYDSNGADTDNITLLAIAQGQPVRTWSSLLERSLWHAEKLRRAEAASDGALQIIRSQADVARLLADRAKKPATGALLSIEGLQNLEGNRGNIQKFYKAGFRMAGITHFFDNELAGSMHGEKKSGLTPFGRQIVRDMEAKGMIVDIAHCSHQCVAEILAMATRPVVSSHGGVQATCKVNRNLTDDEIRGVAKTGGVIGIGYWDAAICDVSPKAIARAIVHVRNLVGIDHVGLGSDFDGATTTGFDTSQLVLVTQALIDAGLTDEDIAKVMGGNVIRVLMQGLPPV
jgi:membrane dipeptidase